MRFSESLSDDAVLREIGSRIARVRLGGNLTQEALATQAGVGVNTVRRLEDGTPVQLSSLIRILRALELLDELERAFPEPVPSPIERLALGGTARRRARTSPRGRPTAWRWGDEESSSS
jgi:transcriptional regulator with XRE-family HTH domain